MSIRLQLDVTRRVNCLRYQTISRTIVQHTFFSTPFHRLEFFVEMNFSNFSLIYQLWVAQCSISRQHFFPPVLSHRIKTTGSLFCHWIFCVCMLVTVFSLFCNCVCKCERAWKGEENFLINETFQRKKGSEIFEIFSIKLKAQLELQQKSRSWNLSSQFYDSFEHFGAFKRDFSSNFHPTSMFQSR